MQKPPWYLPMVMFHHMRFVFMPNVTHMHVVLLTLKQIGIAVGVVGVHVGGTVHAR